MRGQRALPCVMRFNCVINRQVSAASDGGALGGIASKSIRVLRALRTRGPVRRKTRAGLCLSWTKDRGQRTKGVAHDRETSSSRRSGQRLEHCLQMHHLWSKGAEPFPKARRNRPRRLRSPGQDERSDSGNRPRCKCGGYRGRS